MTTIGFLVALAVLTETIVDLFKARIPVPPRQAALLWPLLALAIGIGLAFWAQVGVSEVLGLSATCVAADRVLAGLLIGGGASTIYDWLDRGQVS